MGILDFVLIAIVLISVLIGLKKGFAKMISRFLCIVVALGGSVIATYLLLSIVKQMELFTTFTQTATGWFQQSFMTTSYASAAELKEGLSSDVAGIFSVLAGLSDKLYGAMGTAGVSTLGAYFGQLVATAIVAFVIWLVCYLILKYIALGIKKLLCWFAGIPVIRSVDKIFGIIFSVAVWYIIVIGVLYSAFVIVCARFVPQFAPTVKALVDNSALFTYVHHTNLIGQVLGNLFGVDYSAVALIGA